VLSWLTQQQQNAKPNQINVANWIRNAWEHVTAASIVITWHSIQLNLYEPEL
jgi:hypothetical protein